MAAVFVLLTLLTLVFGASAKKCNGLEETCALPFEKTTFAGTHNSGSGFDGIMKYSFGIPAISCMYRNQDYSFTKQLESGIRFFDLDMCMKRNQIHTCHRSAYAGSIYKVFKQIGDFLRNHKDDVVVIRVSDTSSNFDTNNLLLGRFTGTGGNTGVNDFKNRKGRFPTINEAIAEDKRVFVFIKDAICDKTCHENHPFFLSEDEYIKDTYIKRSLARRCNGVVVDTERKCAAAGDAPFVLASIGATLGRCVSKMATLCNPFVEDSVKKCLVQRLKHGKVVNFIIVDYFDKVPTGKTVVEVANEQNRETAARLI